MRLAPLAALLVVGACQCPNPRDQPDPKEDRLLKKLQAEKERLGKNGEQLKPPGPVAIPEPNPLAARAVLPDAPKVLAITGNPDFTGGKISFHVTGVETSHNVASAKTQLTSDDYFFKVTLAVSLAGGGPIDLTQAKLSANGTDYPVARDAQRLSGTHELTRTLGPEDRPEIILFFEAPQAAAAPGLKLSVAGGDTVLLK